MRGLALFAAGLFLVSPVLADEVSERPDKVTVTIYHEGYVDTAELTDAKPWQNLWRNGLAFITETRTVDVPAGAGRIEFRGVASTIVPQTADVQGLPAEMLERNFDYDLLSPASLLAKSIGNTVRLIRTDEETGKQTEETAIVRTSPSGTILEIGGKFEAFQCSGGPERLVFDKVPEGLRDTPTLSIRTRAPEAGRYTVTLSYIATGMNWSADYVARIRPDGRSLDLTGWITLANFGDTGFVQSPVEVVAGHLETTGTDVPVDPPATRASTECWPTDIDWATMRNSFVDAVFSEDIGAFPDATAEALQRVPSVTVVSTAQKIEASELGDYKLYALPELSDLLARQTKQVQFLDQEDVPFERFYAYSVFDDDSSSETDEPASIFLRLQNTALGKLGKPLPAGSVSVFEVTPQGSPVLAGQDRVHDISVGLPVEIVQGRAMDVRVRRTVTKEESPGWWFNKATRAMLEIDVTNEKPVPITFEVYHPMLERMRIVSESERHVVKPKGATWRFTMAAGERKLLRFTIELPKD
jgi:hypothetical protein